MRRSIARIGNTTSVLSWEEGFGGGGGSLAGVEEAAEGRDGEAAGQRFHVPFSAVELHDERLDFPGPLRPGVPGLCDRPARGGGPVDALGLRIGEHDAEYRDGGCRLAWRDRHRDPSPLARGGLRVLGANRGDLDGGSSREREQS